MAKTRKVQVTLEEKQYRLLEQIARRDGRKLAAVVRESIVRYCVEPEERDRRQRALRALGALDTPVPADYGDWEREYSANKGGPAGESGATADSGLAAWLSGRDCFSMRAS